MAGEKRLYQTIADKMLNLIDSGEFPVGGRLPPERELAGTFNVSRPTVREAIIALEALGRVRVKTGSGIYVLGHQAVNSDDLDNISPFELTESRALVEGEAAALAANLITEEELAGLEQSLLDMARENDDGDLACGDADHRFHQVIAHATRNTVLVSIIEQLWHVRNNAPQVFNAYKAICEMDGATRVEEHRTIYDALVNHDANGARTAMHEHFARIINKLIATSEAEQIEQARKQAQEVRQRFSLDRLVSG